MIKIQRFFLRVALGLGALFLAGLWKVQIVFGTHSLLFTASNIVGPLIGYATGPWIVLATFLLKRFFGWSLLGAPLVSAFSTYIPTLCAAWYWNGASKIRLLLPILCIVVFMIHPVGSQAWVYTLYWLIPVTIYFIPRKSLFVHALAVTFIQHAVGSVIWLYYMPTTSELWYSLLPIVIVERLVFACGMAFGVRCIELCRVVMRKKFPGLRVPTFFFG